MPRKMGSATYTEKPAQVPMSHSDWDMLNELAAILGGAAAAMARFCLQEMAKSRHLPMIMGDPALMYAPVPKRGRKLFNERNYTAKRLQVPLTPEDKVFLEGLKNKTKIPKTGLIREAIHWYVHTSRYRIEQARKMFNLPKLVA